MIFYTTIETTYAFESECETIFPIKTLFIAAFNRSNRKKKK